MEGGILERRICRATDMFFFVSRVFCLVLFCFLFHLVLFYYLWSISLELDCLTDRGGVNGEARR